MCLCPEREEAKTKLHTSGLMKQDRLDRFTFLTLMAIVVFGGNRGKACKPQNTIHLTLCVRLKFSTTHFLNNCVGFVPVMLCLNQVMHSASGQDRGVQAFVRQVEMLI